MTVPSFAKRREQWSSPPVDDIGYLPSADLLTWDDEALLDLISKMAQARYGGWRNWEMRWRTVLGLDRTRGKRVLDYGCGVGLEALQYAKAGNTVSVADISQPNVLLALRVLELNGYKPEAAHLIQPDPPFIAGADEYDVVHCCGVLHHIPEPAPVVEAMASWLVEEGELRLMLYSDRAFKVATGDWPTSRGDVLDEPGFVQHWQHWDPIGGYADWYDEERIVERFGDWFTLIDYQPLTVGGEYVGAVLVKR